MTRRFIQGMALLLPQTLGAAAFWTGVILLCAPLAATLAAEQALLWHKLVHLLGGPLGCLGIGALLLALAVGLLRRAQLVRQAVQDAAAARILDTLRHAPLAQAPPFLLYLRAFETTGRLQVPLFVRLRRASLAATQGVTDDLESHLSLAAQRVAPLIALGRPGEGIGVSRIATADDAWQVDIDLLIERARGVLLLPSDRPGTRWEITQLMARGLLPKVIFVMPPHTVGEYDSAARWDAARAALAPLGLALPSYDRQGLLFELDRQGRLLQAEPLVPHAPQAMRRAMLRLLDPDPPSRTVAQSLHLARRRARHALVLGWAETLRQLSPYALALAAPWAPSPGPEFDPADGWATTFDRTLTDDAIVTARAAQLQALQFDPRALLPITAPDPALGGSAPLAMVGLPQLGDAARARWLESRHQMLTRMGSARCAAAAVGALDQDIALSYLPMQRIWGFVEVETAAMRAGAAVMAAGASAPDPQPGLASALQARLAASLPLPERARFEALHWGFTAGFDLDADQLCWYWRTVLAAAVGDAALARALAAHWAARALAPARHR